MQPINERSFLKCNKAENQAAGKPNDNRDSLSLNIVS